MAKLFGVDVKRLNQGDVERYEIHAEDEACALGIALDELEEDLGCEPKVQWVTIVANPQQAGSRPTDLGTVPAQIRNAMARAEGAERALA